MSLNRRQLLATAAAGMGAAVLSSAHANESLTPRQLIIVFASGGWDTTVVFDPKPGLAGIDVMPGDVADIGGLPIYTHASRPNVTSFFEKHAQRCAIVNGIQVQSLVHNDCSKRLLTGTASDLNPDVGAIAAYELGRNLPAPYLVLGPTAYTGPYASIAARTGTVTQVRALLETTPVLPPGEPGLPPRFAPDGDEQQLIRNYLEARAAREQALRGQHGSNRRRYQDFLTSLTQADALKGVKSSFGDEFTFTLGLNEQIDLAMQAFGNDLCQTVHLEQVLGAWDSHNDSSVQTLMYEDLFAGLGKLTDLLLATPGKTAGNNMLDETAVVVLSEMGRTPRFNSSGGKDHWPVTSAMMFGAGVAGGQVLGGTDNTLAASNVDLQTGQLSAEGQQLQYGHFAAGLLKLAGVDPAAYLPTWEAYDAYMV